MTDRTGSHARVNAASAKINALIDQATETHARQVGELRAENAQLRTLLRALGVEQLPSPVPTVTGADGAPLSGRDAKAFADEPVSIATARARRTAREMAGGTR